MLRRRSALSALHHGPFQDFVADMHLASHARRLLTSSGDGTLAKIDLVAGKVEARSDDGPDELLSGAQTGKRTLLRAIHVLRAARTLTSAKP